MGMENDGGLHEEGITEVRGTDAQLKGLASIATLKSASFFFRAFQRETSVRQKHWEKNIISYPFLELCFHIKMLSRAFIWQRREFDFPPVRRFQYTCIVSWQPENQVEGFKDKGRAFHLKQIPPFGGIFYECFQRYKCLNS